MEDLAQHILDIAFNSLEAGAVDLEITFLEDTATNLLEFSVVDNGRGIKSDELQKIMDPFYTTKKHKQVGLGVPLLQEAVQRCEGTLEIRALPHRGTMVRATFSRDHLDRAPLGDIAGTLIALLAGHDFLHLTYSHHYNDKIFYFDTKDLKDYIGNISLQSPELLVLLREYLNEKITELRSEAGEKFGRAG